MVDKITNNIVTQNIKFMSLKQDNLLNVNRSCNDHDDRRGLLKKSC